MQILVTCSIWQQPSLARLPSQFSAPSLAILQTNCTEQQWFQQVIKKKKKKEGGGNRIPHLFLKTWRALRQNIIFF